MSVEFRRDLLLLLLLLLSERGGDAGGGDGGDCRLDPKVLVLIICMVIICRYAYGEQVFYEMDSDAVFTNKSFRGGQSQLEVLFSSFAGREGIFLSQLLVATVASR